MANVTTFDNNRNNAREYVEVVQLDDRKSLCTECRVCASILCFATFMGIVAFVILAVVAYYQGDPKDYAPYSLIFIAMFVGSVMCRFYTMYQLKNIEENENMQVLKRVEDFVCDARISDIQHNDPITSENLNSGSAQDVEIMETELVRNEPNMAEEYPTVIYHGDFVEYVFGPLPVKMLISKRDVSKDDSNCSGMTKSVLERECSQISDKPLGDSSKSSEDSKEEIQTLPFICKSHSQSSNLKYCRVQSAGGKCVTEGNHMVICIGNASTYEVGSVARKLTSDEIGVSENVFNITVTEECRTDQQAQLDPHDTLVNTNPLYFDEECSDFPLTVGRCRARTKTEKQLFPDSFYPCTDVFDSGNVTSDEVIINEVTEYPMAIHNAEATQEEPTLVVEKSFEEKQEQNTEPNVNYSQDIIRQQFYEGDIGTSRSSLNSDEESDYGYSESEAHEDEEYPVVRRHGDIVEYIFGPLPPRMLEERRKLRNSEAGVLCR